MLLAPFMLTPPMSSLDIQANRFSPPLLGETNKQTWNPSLARMFLGEKHPKGQPGVPTPQGEGDLGEGPLDPAPVKCLREVSVYWGFCVRERGQSLLRQPGEEEIKRTRPLSYSCAI